MNRGRRLSLAEFTCRQCADAEQQHHQGGEAVDTSVVTRPFRIEKGYGKVGETVAGIDVGGVFAHDVLRSFAQKRVEWIAVTDEIPDVRMPGCEQPDGKSAGAGDDDCACFVPVACGGAPSCGGNQCDALHEKYVELGAYGQHCDGACEQVRCRRSPAAGSIDKQDDCQQDVDIKSIVYIVCRQLRYYHRIGSCGKRECGCPLCRGEVPSSEIVDKQCRGGGQDEIYSFACFYRADGRGYGRRYYLHALGIM